MFDITKHTLVNDNNHVYNKTAIATQNTTVSNNCVTKLSLNRVCYIIGVTRGKVWGGGLNLIPFHD